MKQTKQTKQGNTIEASGKKAELKIVKHENESYFKICNHNAMRSFFMSIVSDANHWMFISSNGGLTAGRKNPEHALFPYYTEDKITESADITGSKTIFQIHTDQETLTWEPFSERFIERYTISRNLYKSTHGNKIIFEEINHDLGLAFRYQWNTGKVFGFIRNAELVNSSDNDYNITLLDGIQNIMPYGVPSDLQQSASNLVDAYKRSELEPAAGIGVYALSAIIVDRAEPSEALKANIAWSLGLDHPKHLLSSLQLKNFRQKKKIQEERDVKGEKGAYFISTDILLSAKAEKKWTIVANVNQTQSQIISLSKSIQEDEQIGQKIRKDIDSGTQSLIRLVAAADGLQFTADQLHDTRHFSNVLFNIMRGGVFDNNYQIEKDDFVSYLAKANKDVVSKNQGFIKSLDDKFSLSGLQHIVSKGNDVDLIRLSVEYLPLKFSRRHGDPSRPWNYFTINTQSEKDGSKILDYEGNWRDLFQNWEALACSYPEFIEGMIFKFLNASTFDGYNPYRVTKDGFDWETIEPDNPWSYIGYWGDHQIIYLLKFLEIIDKHQPGKLQDYFDKEWFVYAAVPYIIKPYEQILKNPKDTIAFDLQWDKTIRKKRSLLGADGALLTDSNKGVYHVNFVEKILTAVLAKVSNFIPEAGIWLNTQRPEWNDANNALVGNGVSMVTLYYLRRFMIFFQRILKDSALENIKVSGELIEFYHNVRETLNEFSPLLKSSIADTDRKVFIDRMGTAASEYRQHVYKSGFWGKKRSVSISGLQNFTAICLDFIEHSIRSNQRADKLYHAYNLITIKESGVSFTHLNEMLEGQVAVLSSGHLSSAEALEVLDALKSSALFREDQYSYILYPNRDLPGFLSKNTIPEVDIKSSELLTKLVSDGNKEVVEQDVNGCFHFNGNFRNADDLKNALNKLSGDTYNALVGKEKKVVLDVFEKVFNHKAFTGRSGTFFGYEGLGSIYWHMVSKLLLAVQECCLKAIDENANPAITGRLMEHYYEIEAGIGVHKSPGLYGAFPTDPYSHTPQHRGAQQPGMTGQVKEDILAHWGETGVFVANGKLHFNPCLLRKSAFAKEVRLLKYLTIHNELKSLTLEPDSLFFTYCQTPVVYKIADTERMEVIFVDGAEKSFETLCLDHETSRQVFHRTGRIERIVVYLTKTCLG